MGDLTGAAFSALFLTEDELERAAEAAEVHPPEVEGEEERAGDQPDDHQRDPRARYLDAIEDEGLERLREGERESIDLLTEALRSLGGARSQE